VSEFPTEETPAGDGPTAGPPELHFDEHDDAAWREDFKGLLNLGAIRGWFEWCGHRIALRTLTTDEELLVSQLTREYEGGLGGTKAYATALCGLAVEAVDRQPMPVPLGEEPGRPYKWALERFNYARRWYPPTIDAIFDAYLRLEIRQREVMTELGKSSAQADDATPGLNARSASPSDEASSRALL
jgi:hypothetical protein